MTLAPKLSFPVRRRLNFPSFSNCVTLTTTISHILMKAHMDIPEDMAISEDHMDAESSWDELADAPPRVPPAEPMADRLRRVRADLEDLNNYHNISISTRRNDALLQYYSSELEALSVISFEALDQHDRVDFLLLRNFLRLRRHQLERRRSDMSKWLHVIPFSPLIVKLCEDRQDVKPIEPERVAGQLDDIARTAVRTRQDVQRGDIQVSKTSGYKASKAIEELRSLLREFFDFYASYHPSFDWWVTAPFQAADTALAQYLIVVQTKLAGMQPVSGMDDIIGEPIGRKGLLEELEAEMIPYSPDELLILAKKQFAWCERQMKKVSSELGFGDDWKEALEHVKAKFVPPGQQTQLVLELAREGSAYVQKHDLVTVPRIAEETWRMFMMPPEQQRVAPFFLGGPSILVSSPTTDMEHDLKEMVLKGNNRHFSRATAFHELIPGHRLQLYMATRHNSHRPQLISTPFFVEGWALYWEMVFWERGDFFVSPEDRVGSMFWRMHRCARIIFSLNFHLGKMAPQECVDLLVDWVGHERSTAEGEVRRSLEGSYGPLYQAAYMLGALQMWALREEAVGSGRLGEKQFHDEVLRTGGMPIELVRALVLDKKLTPDYESSWRFFD